MKNIPLMSANKILVAFISLIAFLSFDNQSFAQSYKIKTIVIDAGHGGKDGSTRGAYSTEKEVALKTALRLGQLIKERLPDIQVIYTRTEDLFIPLYERIAIANKANADLFISIHCNDMPVKGRQVPTGTYAKDKNGRFKRDKQGQKIPLYKTVYSKSTGTKGTETFVSGYGRIDEQDEAIKRENAAIFLEENYEENYQGFREDDPESVILLSFMKTMYRTKSLKLAKYIQEQYVAVGRVNRGVQEKSLAVLARAGMPAVLTEIGFISNPEEEDYMNSESGQQEITLCLLNAILSYKQSVEI